MKKLRLSIIVAIFLTGLAVASANAQMGGGRGVGLGCGMGMLDGAHGKHISTMLGLDDNQTVQVKSILFKLRKDMIKKRAEIEVAEVELEEILGKVPVDMKTVEAKVKQFASLKADAALLHIQRIQDIKAKLNPEQEKKLTEMMQSKGMEGGMMNRPMMKGHMYRGHHPEPAQETPE
jgi:Spy/CpxP family protein refolding chaperone